MTAALAEDPESWAHKAACRNSAHDPDDWYPERSEKPDWARRTCKEKCPVRVECGSYAVAAGERDGVWAGYRMDRTTERRALRLWLGLPDEQAAAIRRTCQQCREIFETDEPSVRTCPDCRKFVDAAPARAHVEQLLALDWSLMRITEASGVPHPTLVDLCRTGQGCVRRMRRDNAEKIMALEITAYREAVAG